jgi:uncharacterized membrane protein HdeD (DUF308 family)
MKANVTLSLEQSSLAMREAMRETVRTHSFWYVAQGVLMIAAGAVAVIHPVATTAALVILLGWLMIFGGLVQAVGLISARHLPHFWLQAISVVLFCVVGFLFLMRPDASLLTLTSLLIVFFAAEGVAKIVFALTIRPLRNWMWVLASGILGLGLAIYLGAQMTSVAVWFLGVLLGIGLISEGAAITMLAWASRRL